MTDVFVVFLVAMYFVTGLGIGAMFYTDKGSLPPHFSDRERLVGTVVLVFAWGVFVVFILFEKVVRP